MKGARPRWNTKREKSLHLTGRETGAGLQEMFSKENLKIKRDKKEVTKQDEMMSEFKHDLLKSQMRNRLTPCHSLDSYSQCLS